MEWPAVESRKISYHINSAVLEASITCQPGYQLPLNNSLRDQRLHQIRQLTARCLGNVWDIKPPQCLGMTVLGMHAFKRSHFSNCTPYTAEIQPCYRAILRRVRYCHVKSSVCLAVRPSVTLRYCGHIVWTGLKIITLMVRLGSSLSAVPNSINLVQGDHSQISCGIALGMWCGKSGCSEHKAVMSLSL